MRLPLLSSRKTSTPNFLVSLVKLSSLPLRTWRPRPYCHFGPLTWPPCPYTGGKVCAVSTPNRNASPSADHIFVRFVMVDLVNPEKLGNRPGSDSTRGEGRCQASVTR